MLVLPIDFLSLLAPTLLDDRQWKATVAAATITIILLTGGGRYRARLHLSVLDELPSLVTRVLTATAIVAALIAFRYDETPVVAFLITSLIGLAFLVVGRVLTTTVILLSRKRRVTNHPTIIIGGGKLAQELAYTLRNQPRYGLDPRGFVDVQDSAAATTVVPRLGSLDRLDEIVCANKSDVLLVADGGFSEKELYECVRTPACLPADLLVVPRMRYFNTQNALGDHIGSIPVMRIKTPLLDGPARAVKRLSDVLVSGAALLLVSPILAVLAVAVRVEGGPGVIFRQRRVGRDGVEFDCLKLRSMRPVDDAESSTQWSIADDERVGPVGRFMRRTSLDELPQLWNIIRGDMTLVGPRPERPHFVQRFSEEFERYEHRHRVQAGLTGLAQVSGLRGGDASIADRARYDNYYIENWTLWLDVKIMIRTCSEVVFGRGR